MNYRQLNVVYTDFTHGEKVSYRYGKGYQFFFLWLVRYICEKLSPLTSNTRGTVLVMTQERLLGLFPRFQLPKCIGGNWSIFGDQHVTGQRTG